MELFRTAFNKQDAAGAVSLDQPEGKHWMFYPMDAFRAPEPADSTMS
jgi:hypothetical protein